MSRLSAWMGRVLGQGSGPASRDWRVAWLDAGARPPLIYAIGDVHGCLDQLRQLEALITADAASVEGEKWLVTLGDHIDRGPASAAVLDHLLKPPPPGFRRIALKGNHEAMLLDALADPVALRHWLANGGDVTLASYGLGHAAIESLRQGRGRASRRRQLLQAHLPDEHLAFLQQLPLGLSVPGFVFVHAGLRPGVPIADQVEADLLWIRTEFLEAVHDFGAVVVHGHTPVPEPFVSATRIGIDTGCFSSGRLAALRIDAAGNTSILTARA